MNEEERKELTDINNGINKKYGDYMKDYDNDILLNALKESYELIEIDDNKYLKFKFDKFFRQWFTSGEERPIVLVFSANLSVTNMQYAELLSLLSCHCKDHSSKKEDYDFQFLTKKDIKNSITGLLESFSIDLVVYDEIIADEEIVGTLEKVTELYYDIIKRIIVIEHFNCSCIVYSPPYISFDLSRMCALSGYIHTCGYLIYARNTLKSNKEELVRYFSEYLELINEKKYLYIYAHELFDKYEVTYINTLKYGLNDLKLYLEKHYIGNIKMYDLITAINEQYIDKVYIPICNIPHDLEKLTVDKEINKESSYWLYVDCDFDSSSLTPDKSKSYYILYEQCFKNDNPMFIFDENKPAWVENTTIPHSLMSAMINLSKPWKVKDDVIGKNVVRILDPFIGSGTTLIEAIKHNDNKTLVKVYGSDLKKVTKIVVRDNYDLLTTKVSKLEKLVTDLDSSQLINLLDEHKFVEFKNILWGLRDEKISNKALMDFSKFSMRDRIYIYLILRVMIKYNFELQNELTDSEDFNLEEVEKKDLLNRLRGFISYRNKQYHIIPNTNKIIKYQGTYSTSCAYKYPKFNQAINTVEVFDVIKHLKTRPKYDLIITDPPYGFNTVEDIVGLADMYFNMLKGFLQTLDKEGQIILSLPEQSYTGRHISYFTHKDIVTLQVYTIAELEKMEVITQSYNTPNNALYRPPYYWNSDKSLRRSIVHFCIRKEK